MNYQMNYLGADLIARHLIQYHEAGDQKGMLDFFKRHKITKQDVIETIFRKKIGDVNGLEEAAFLLKAYVNDHPVLQEWYAPDLARTKKEMYTAFEAFKVAANAYLAAGGNRQDLEVLNLI